MNAPLSDQSCPAPWPMVSLCLWLMLIGAMFGFLWMYESTAGSQGDPKADWPTGVSLKPAPKGRTLLMFAHPRCPCSRASLHEFQHILQNCPSLESARIIFYCPPNAGGDWTDTSLVRTAQSLPGVEVSFDEGGDLAEKFGVATSGHILLYDAHQDLLFSGGITALRNHEGANSGRESVMALIQGQSSITKETPVFGCPLDNGSPVCPENRCNAQP